MLMLFANSWDFPDIVSDLSGSFSWLNEEISVTNLSSENNLLTFRLTAPVVIILLDRCVEETERKEHSSLTNGVYPQ